MIRRYRDNAGRDGIAAAPGVNGQAMAGRVLSELAGQRGRLILVTGDRHGPTSHELTSPDPLAQLARLLTNLPGYVPAVLATVALWPPFTMCPVAQSGGHRCRSPKPLGKGARRETIPLTEELSPGQHSVRPVP